MPRLVIQIPCFNEAQDLPVALAALPKQIEGIDSIEVLVIDDGSTDGTSDVAQIAGVAEVVKHPRNRGLARTFMTGIEASLKRGADIIVNTDADNQYCAEDIAALIAPILRGEADIVIGRRDIARIDGFSPTKKLLQRLGSLVVSVMSGVRIQDATSGFRAFRRSAALRMNVFTKYTYTIETIVLAGHKNLMVAEVPIRVNAARRPSRLMRSSAHYILHSVLSIVRMMAVYQPFKIFLPLASLFLLSAVTCAALWLYEPGTPSATQSAGVLLAAEVSLMLSLSCGMFGLIADVISVNRRLLEQLELENRSRLWS